MADLTAKRAQGRPKGVLSKYTVEFGERILGRIAKGETLEAICRDPEVDVSAVTVRNWTAEHPAFGFGYARAREHGADAIIQECLDIADDNSRDIKLVGREGQGREACNTEFVQRSKLRVETRLKLLKVWDPKRFNDRGPIGPIEPIGGENITFSGGLPAADE
jgi:hypothetical protein